MHHEIGENIDAVMGAAMAFLAVFFIIGLLIAFVVAGSAVIISSMERDVEYATLDTLGVSRGQVAKGILIEMAILSVFASVLSIPFSYVFGELFAIVMEEVIFYFPVTLTITTIIITVMSGFLFILMSATVPIRYSGKLDTEKTIRERTAG